MTSSSLEILAALRARDIRVWAEGDKLRFDAPRGALTEELRARLVAGKAEVIALLRDATTGTVIPHAPRGGRLPAAPSQRALWLVEQLTTSGAAYLLPVALRLRGAVDESAIDKALAFLSERHEVLRTALRIHDGALWQEILSPKTGSLEVRDLRGEADPESSWRAEAKDSYAPFVLAEGPLWRARLFKLRNEESVLLLVLHHAIFDGWSLGVLLPEFMAAYASFGRGEVPVLPAPGVQYADWAAWQAQRVDTLAPRIDAWREALLALPSETPLPTDRARPAQPSGGGAVATHVVDPATEAALAGFATAQGVTPFAVTAAALAVVLNRTSGARDMGFATPMANRTLPELQSVVGLVANTVVIRARVDEDATFVAIVRQVQSSLRFALGHQDVPFEAVVDALSPPRRAGVAPLAQVMLVQQEGALDVLQAPGVSAEIELLHPGSARFDLLLNIWRPKGRLRFDAEYATDLFDAATVENLVALVEQAVVSGISHPEATVRSLSLGPAASPASKASACAQVKSALGMEEVSDVRILDAAGRPVAMGVRGELEVDGQATGMGARWRSDGDLEIGVPLGPWFWLRGVRVPTAPLEEAVRASGLVADVVIRPRPGALIALVVPAAASSLESLEIPPPLDAVIEIPALPRQADGSLDEVALDATPLIDAAVMARLRDLGGEDSAVDKGSVFSTRARPSALDALTDRYGVRVPIAWKRVPTLPRNPDGSIDRARLSHSGDNTGRERQIAQIWAEALGVASVGREDDFFELGGSSLVATQVAARMESIMGRSVPLALLFAAPTVARLSAALDEQGGDPAVLLPLHVPPVIVAPPLFLIHPAGGSAALYRDFAKAVGDRAVYGLHAIGLYGRPPDMSIDALADRYAEQISRQNGLEPCDVGGLSFGALVAFEVARRLSARGVRVRALLLDATAPGPHAPVLRAPDDEVEGLCDLVRVAALWSGQHLAVDPEALRQLDPEARLARVAEALRPAESLFGPAIGADALRALLAVYRASHEAYRLYTPASPVELPLVVVRATSFLEWPGIPVPAQDAAPDLGWARWTRDRILALEAAGNHLNMMQAPHVAELARLVARHLPDNHGVATAAAE